MITAYYRLTKPGIVYGNAFTTLAAFLFASGWHFSAGLFCATMIGIALVIASACVFNNYIDRDIDRKMSRTKDRALAAGTISARAALSFASVLGLIGFFLLAVYVNALTAAVALFGFIFYVAIYGYAKRASHWGTVVGSVSGAMPILVGYTAVADRLDLSALILFLSLALWQMPHFYAIAIYRGGEYAAAGIPVLPAVKGMRVAKYYITAYIVAFTLAAASLSMFGHAGYVYLVAVLVLGTLWFMFSVKGFWVTDDEKWARTLFFASLVVLMGFSIALAAAPLVP